MGLLAWQEGTAIAAKRQLIDISFCKCPDLYAYIVSGSLVSSHKPKSCSLLCQEMPEEMLQQKGSCLFPRVLLLVATAKQDRVHSVGA